MTKDEFIKIMLDALNDHVTERERSRDEWWATLEEFVRLRRAADYKMGRR